MQANALSPTVMVSMAVSFRSFFNAVPVAPSCQFVVDDADLIELLRQGTIRQCAAVDQSLQFLQLALKLVGGENHTRPALVRSRRLQRPVEAGFVKS